MSPPPPSPPRTVAKADPAESRGQAVGAVQVQASEPAVQIRRTSRRPVGSLRRPCSCGRHLRQLLGQTRAFLKKSSVHHVRTDRTALFSPAIPLA